MFTNWTFLHPKMTMEHLGYIPQFLSLDNPEPAAKQIARSYVGGWNPFEGFEKLEGGILRYPGDPKYRPLATAQFRDEKLHFYNHAWFMIEQKNGSWEVSRLD